MVTKKETEYVSESDDEPEPETAKKQPIPKVCLEVIKSSVGACYIPVGM